MSDSTQTTALRQFQLVRFAHERKGGPVHRIVSVMHDGMVELHDMSGYFAPRLFVVADDIGDIPPDPDRLREDRDERRAMEREFPYAE